MKRAGFIRAFGVLAAISLGGCASTGEKVKTPALDEAGYRLLWSDEFEGKSLSKENWNIELREKGWTNNELQAYTASPDNVFVRDGTLVLKAVKKVATDGTISYTSGKVNGQNRKDFTYGKVVVRAKAPEGKGLWPAAWMMPTLESRYGQWPRCGEIDIMEVLGSETDRAYGTIHYGVPHRQNQGTVKLEKGSFAESFHEYAVEWEPARIRFFIDGALYYETEDWFTAKSETAEEEAYPAPFNQSFFVQLNLAVGGNWPGDPDASTDFDKAEFLIDYVRVYQKESYDTNVARKEKKLLMRESDASGNFIHNGDFSIAESLSDGVDWGFLLFANGKGEAAIQDGMLAVTTESEGTVEYSVQVIHPGLPMWKGTKYRLSFEARSDSARNAVVTVSAPDANWIRYLPDTRFALTDSWQTYSYEFTMKNKDDANGRLEFNLGKLGSVAPVYIRAVRLEALNLKK